MLFKFFIRKFIKQFIRFLHPGFDPLLQFKGTVAGRLNNHLEEETLLDLILKTPDDISQLLIGAHLGIKIALDNRGHHGGPGLRLKTALPHLQRIKDGVIVIGDLPGKSYLFTRIEHLNHFLVSLPLRQRLALDFIQNDIKTRASLLCIPIAMDHAADKNSLIKFGGVILDIIQSHFLECGNQLLFRVLLSYP